MSATKNTVFSLIESVVFNPRFDLDSFRLQPAIPVGLTVAFERYFSGRSESKEAAVLDMVFCQQPHHNHKGDFKTRFKAWARVANYYREDSRFNCAAFCDAMTMRTTPEDKQSQAQYVKAHQQLKLWAELQSARGLVGGLNRLEQEIRERALAKTVLTHQVIYEEASEFKSSHTMADERAHAGAGTGSESRSRGVAMLRVTPERALDVINSGNAVVKMVRADNKDLHFNLAQYADPVDNRPAREVNSPHKINYRTRSTQVIHLTTPARDLATYYSRVEDPLAYLHTPVKKNSKSVYAKHGRITYFDGNNRRYYKIVFGFDYRLLNNKNNKYVFTENQSTNQKSWRVFSARIPQAHSFYTLSNAVDTRPDDYLSTNTEALLAETRASLAFIGAPSETPESIVLAKQVAEIQKNRLKLDIPVFVCDGENPAWHVTDFVYRAMLDSYTYFDNLRLYSNDSIAVFMGAFEAAVYQGKWANVVSVLLSLGSYGSKIKDYVLESIQKVSTANLATLFLQLSTTQVTTLKRKHPEVYALFSRSISPGLLAHAECKQLILDGNYMAVLPLIDQLSMASKQGVLYQLIDLGASVYCDVYFTALRAVIEKLPSAYRYTNGLYTEAFYKKVLLNRNSVNLEFFLPPQMLNIKIDLILKVAIQHSSIMVGYIIRNSSLDITSKTLEQVVNDFASRVELRTKLQVDQALYERLHKKALEAGDVMTAYKLCHIVRPADIAGEYRQLMSSSSEYKQLQLSIEALKSGVGLAVIANNVSRLGPSSILALLRQNPSLLIHLSKYQIRQLPATQLVQFRAILNEHIMASRILVPGMMCKYIVLADQLHATLDKKEKQAFLTSFGSLVERAHDVADLFILARYIMASKGAVDRVRQHRNVAWFRREARYQKGAASYQHAVSLVQAKLGVLARSAGGTVRVDEAQKAVFEQALTFKTKGEVSAEVVGHSLQVVA